MIAGFRGRGVKPDPRTPRAVHTTWSRSTIDMPRFRILIVVLLTVLIGSPRPAASQPAPNTPVKYWIFLEYDEHEVGKTTAPTVSSRALQRRALRARVADGLDPDRPVAALHVERLAALGVTPIVQSRWLQAVSAWLDPVTLQSVKALPFVREVRPVGVAIPLDNRSTRAPFEPASAARPVSGMVASAEPLAFNFGFSLTQMMVAGAVATVEAGWNGQGVILGVIDTGWGDISTHPALRPITDSGRLKGDRDFTGKADDGDRHARAVLSVAAGFLDGSLIGPAYGADILHARTEYVPTETNQEEDAFVAGLEWMEAEGVDVVNVSLGYSVFDAGQRSYTYADMNGRTAVTTLAAEHAAALGVVVVAAAGNEGWCSSPAFCWYYIASPADGPSVISAGGVTSSRTRSSFSSFGPTSDGRTKPNVSAMASSVFLADSGSGFSFSQGTSFASPMIAGIVAQVLQADPSLSPSQVRELLQSTASQAGAPNNSLGWGIVNAQAAMATITGREKSETPANLVLGAWPNPFTDRVDVVATFPPEATGARLDLIDILGRTIATFEAPTSTDGTWRLTIDTSGFAPGLVLYRLTAGSRIASGSLIHAQ